MTTIKPAPAPTFGQILHWAHYVSLLLFGLFLLFLAAAVGWIPGALIGPMTYGNYGVAACLFLALAVIAFFQGLGYGYQRWFHDHPPLEDGEDYNNDGS